MRSFRVIFALLWSLGLDPAVFAVESAHAEPAAGVVAHAVGHGEEHEEHGLPPAAVPVFNIGPIQVTNSMIVVWAVALGLIAFAQLATRNIKQVPDGLQNFWEWLVESLYDFLGGILGPALVKKSFWFFGTVFILILFTNWMGLIPGVGTIGRGVTNAAGHFHVTEPYLRGGNADLNMTLAMSILFFLFWIVWSVQALGVGGVIKHLFGGQGGESGFMKVFLAVIFIIVGLIEVVSILFRPVSLSFRLFGNVFAGENILEAMMGLVPALGWIIPLPFYFLELLVGLVQALVFTLLTAVFTALMCAHPEHESDEAAGHHGKKAH